jgi:hypothetical protein
MRRVETEERLHQSGILVKFSAHSLKTRGKLSHLPDGDSRIRELWILLPETLEVPTKKNASYPKIPLPSLILETPGVLMDL